MKVQFVTPPDAAGYVRAHVEISETQALPLKFKAEEYTEEKALEAAQGYLDAQANRPEEPDEVQQAINRIGADVILERLGTEVVAEKLGLVSEEQVQARIDAAVQAVELQEADDIGGIVAKGGN